MDKEEISREAESTACFLRSFSHSKKIEDFVTNLECIKLRCVTLIPYAEAASYQDIQANGIWSLIKVNVKFFELIKSRTTSDQNVNEFLKMSRGLIWILDQCLEMCKISQNALSESTESSRKEKDVNANLIPFDLNTIRRDLTSVRASQYNQRELLWKAVNDDQLLQAFLLCVYKHTLFFGDSILGFRIKATQFFLALTQGPLLRIPQLFQSWDSYLDTIRIGTLNFSIGGAIYLHEQWRRLAPVVKLYLYDFGVLVQDIYVISQNKIILKEDASKLEIMEGQRTSRPIRCVISRKAKCVSHETVMLHFHGGGYLLGTPESNQEVVNTWCKAIPGLTIISVEYTLHRTISVPLQDVLDVYMWLVTDQDDVRSKLGFVPKKIIMSGDSAGGGLCLSLSFMLHDLQNLGFSLPQPTALVLLYAFMDLSMRGRPSLFLGSIEPVVSGILGFLVHMVACGWFDHHPEESKESKEPAPNGWKAWMMKKIGHLSEYKLTPPYFWRSRENFNRAFDYCIQRQVARYASPILHSEIEEIKIPLFLITAEFCSLLDDSVVLAKAWKGPVKLDVMSDLPHAFVHWVKNTPYEEKVQRICTERIKEALLC